jgi:hypothetical protein
LASTLNLPAGVERIRNEGDTDHEHEVGEKSEKEDTECFSWLYEPEQEPQQLFVSEHIDNELGSEPGDDSVPVAAFN